MLQRTSMGYCEMQIMSICVTFHNQHQLDIFDMLRFYVNSAADISPCLFVTGRNNHNSLTRQRRALLCEHRAGDRSGMQVLISRASHIEPPPGNFPIVSLILSANRRLEYVISLYEILSFIIQNILSCPIYCQERSIGIGGGGPIITLTPLLQLL